VDIFAGHCGVHESGVHAVGEDIRVRRGQVFGEVAGIEHLC
jgi:hypothetical protein